MFVKLTNANPKYLDQPVILNSEHMVSVFVAEVTREDDRSESVTVVYCPPHGNWEVKETPEQVFNLLNS
jgi:hypothetical protein